MAIHGATDQYSMVEDLTKNKLREAPNKKAEKIRRC